MSYSTPCREPVFGQLELGFDSALRLQTILKNSSCVDCINKNYRLNKVTLFHCGKRHSSVIGNDTFIMEMMLFHYGKRYCSVMGNNTIPSQGTLPLRESMLFHYGKQILFHYGKQYYVIMGMDTLPLWELMLFHYGETILFHYGNRYSFIMLNNTIIIGNNLFHCGK